MEYCPFLSLLILQVCFLLRLVLVTVDFQKEDPDKQAFYKVFWVF
jgi:hypothetical protein